MKRVLHFYSGNRFGGVEVLLVSLQDLKGLAPQIEPSFVLCFDGMLAGKLRERGAKLTLIPEVRFSRPWSLWIARAALKKYLRANPVDVVVCHEFWPYAVAAPVVSKLGLPLVIWHHSPASGYRLERSVRRYPPTLAITCSEFVARNLNELEPADRVHVCYAPVVPPRGESADRARVRAELGVRDDECVILHVGRLADYKGQMELLHAAARLKDSPIQIWFVGASQNDDEARFFERMREFVIDNDLGVKVRFLGHRDDVYRLYAAADVYCQANKLPEPYGFTYVEALYSGLAVVASNNGGSAEILRDSRSGQNYGVLVTPGDVGALTDALRELISKRDARERFRSTAPVRARELNDPAIAMKRIEELMTKASAH